MKYPSLSNAENANIQGVPKGIRTCDCSVRATTKYSYGLPHIQGNYNYTRMWKTVVPPLDTSFNSSSPCYKHTGGHLTNERVCDVVLLIFYWFI